MRYEIWNPFEEIERMRKRMDALFRDFGTMKVKVPKTLMIREPLVDIVDKKNELQAIIELPGVDPKDVKVTVRENNVEIKAEKKQETEEKKKGFYRQERKYSGFYKAFSLPTRINPDKATYEFKNGLLTLHLPKAKMLPPKEKVLQLK